MRARRLSEAEYRVLGDLLKAAAESESYRMSVDIIREIALTGCRRMEMITLRWAEVDTNSSCLRLIDSKEGSSVRPIGLPVVEYLEKRRKEAVGDYVFPGRGGENAFGSFPNHWKNIFAASPLADITPQECRRQNREAARRTQAPLADEPKRLADGHDRYRPARP